MTAAKKRFFRVYYESNRGLTGDLAFCSEGYPSREQVISMLVEHDQPDPGEMFVIRGWDEFKNEADYEAWIRREKNVDTENE